MKNTFQQTSSAIVHNSHIKHVLDLIKGKFPQGPQLSAVIR